MLQSGGHWSLKPSAMSDDELFRPGPVVAWLGIKYHDYCANVGRTYVSHVPRASPAAVSASDTHTWHTRLGERARSRLDTDAHSIRHCAVYVYLLAQDLCSNVVS